MSQRNIQTQEALQQQQQVQVQALSAQQVIAVRLTEMSLEALQQRVENECLENPWLEKDPSADAVLPAEGSTEENMQDMMADYRSEEDVPDYLLRTQNGTPTAETVEYGDTLSFYDQLKAQMAEFDLSDHEKQVLEYLIGSLDDDGLLKKNLAQVADELEIYQAVNTSPAEVERLLHVLWQFDPAGVGARSLQECLLIQVRRDERNPMRKLLQQLLETEFDNFIHKRWDRIQRRMKLSDGQVERLQREVVKLNPRPGMALGERLSRSHQITPDFIVEADGYGNISMSLNQGNVPALVISPDATEKLRQYEGKKLSSLSRAAQEDLRFTRSYVERGQMFINALAMRRESMIRTMQGIIRLQKNFFQEGDEAQLRPMKLEDVSKVSGVSISVVSRVCNSKYVQTPYGTFPLKWFFSGRAQQTDGDEVSARRVMAVLREQIEHEDKRQPLSDERLTQMLNEKGYQIARRTVAKYREQMGFPVARLRK